MFNVSMGIQDKAFNKELSIEKTVGDLHSIVDNDNSARRGEVF